MLLATCFLLPTSCFLLLATGHFLLATCYLLLATHHMSLANCYFLLASCYLLISSFYFVLATCYWLIANWFLLFTTCYLIWLKWSFSSLLFLQMGGWVGVEINANSATNWVGVGADLGRIGHSTNPDLGLILGFLTKFLFCRHLRILFRVFVQRKDNLLISKNNSLNL